MLPLFFLLIGLAPAQALAAPPQAPSYALADFDRDGWVDVYVVDPNGTDRLFRNLGDGAFAEVTAEAGLAGITGSRAALWQDLDGDGFEDLYVSARTGPSRLLQNTGAGAFVDVSAYAGLDLGQEGELDARWLDYDLDRRVDLWLSTHSGDRFLRNLGDGTFEPVELVPLRPPFAPGVPGVGVLPGAEVVSGGAVAEGPADPARERGTVVPGLGANLTRPVHVAPAGLSVATGCANALRDASGGSCSLLGSSAPELGMLFPLSTALNVNPAGRVGMGTSTPGASLHVDGYDGFLATGRFGRGSLPAAGPGTRLMWYPRKGALRVGKVSGGQWDDANIGRHSLALGQDTLASGPYSVAIGLRAKATDLYSMALGWGCEVTGDGGTALGVFCRARATDTTAIGDRAVAAAESAIAIGTHNIATGRFSMALGLLTHADSTHSTAIGTCNVGGGDRVLWNDGDPLFEVGNGSPAAPSNALTVLKDGRVGIGTAKPQFLLEVNGSAAKPGGGSWSVSSDARLKKDIRPLEGALDTLLALRGVSFEYRDPAAIHELPGRHTGFIAQEVERVLPEWVEEVGETKRLTVRGFEALAVEAMRELEHENETLRARCERNESELAALRQELRALAERVR